MEQLVSDCLIWPGALNSGGYPVTWESGKAVYAHRVIMRAQRGEVVMHLCDNPACVNPEHLKIGTAKENSEDMVRKNRQAKGEATASSKLTELEVHGIRSMQGTAASRVVARLYNISKTNVLDIWRRKIWRHI